MTHLQESQEKKKKSQDTNPTIAIIGLGYVGLPLAVAFSRHAKVIGFDICPEKIDTLKKGIDNTGELSSEELNAGKVQFTGSIQDLSAAMLFIVTVPTPIDEHKRPDLSALEKASAMIGSHLNKGAIVVYESTVYPGVTEEICAPILEKHSGLTFKKDFHIGYSPERISPGEKDRTLTKIKKIVSGSSSETRQFLAKLYGKIIEAGIYEASSIKVAEAAKVIENTQRDLNVALMNELSIIFNKLNINTLDVIEAASTKWNFMAMTPGLVGGHCIGVDPYYLTFKAEQLNYLPQVILAGRRINDGMGKYVAEQAIKHLINAEIPVRKSKVLIMGITFKENVSDIRNSKVVDIISELQSYGISPLVTDPYACPNETQKEYGLNLTELDAIQAIDLLIIATPHRVYKELGASLLLEKMKPAQQSTLIFDIKGLFKEELKNHQHVSYWTL